MNRHRIGWLLAVGACGLCLVLPAAAIAAVSGVALWIGGPLVAIVAVVVGIGVVRRRPAAVTPASGASPPRRRC